MLTGWAVESGQVVFRRRLETRKRYVGAVG